MTPLQQSQFDQAIGQELLRSTPKGWRGVLLTARLSDGPADSWSLRITLERRPPGLGVAFVSPALEQRLAEMFAAHRRADSGMVEARYIVEGIDSSPSIISEFEYRE